MEETIETLERLKRQVDMALGMVRGGLLYDSKPGEYGLAEGEMLIGDFRIVDLRVDRRGRLSFRVG